MPTLEQALTHLYNLALEASVPAKVHQNSQEAYKILKALIEEKKKE